MLCGIPTAKIHFKCTVRKKERKSPSMANMFISLLLLSWLVTCSCGSQFTVGDSIWSIPPGNDFYANWSSSYTFHTGDTLYFDFSSGLYNVIHVSRREHDSCSSNQAFKAFMEGPVEFPFVEKGVFYFICNVSNYCQLGLKVSVVVEERTNDPTPSPPRPVPI